LNSKSSVTQTKERGKERKKKNTALAQSTPACVTQKASMGEHTPGVKIQSNHNDPSGTVFWLPLLRDTGRDFRLQRSL